MNKFSRNNKIYYEREAGAKFTYLAKKYDVSISSVRDAYHRVKNNMEKHGTLYGLPSQLVTALRRGGITSKIEAIEAINKNELYPNSIYMYSNVCHNLLCDFLEIKPQPSVRQLRIETSIRYLESLGYEVKLKQEKN